MVVVEVEAAASECGGGAIAATGGLLLEAVYIVKDWIRLEVCGVCGTFYFT